MAVYRWKGIKGDKFLNEKIEALNKDEAAFKLKKEQIIITYLEKIEGEEIGTDEPFKKRALFTSKVPVKEIMEFTKKFSTMIRAGLTVIETLELLKNQIEHDRFKAIMETIYSDVEAGTPIATSFGKHEKVFDSIYANMIKAGEVSGKLDFFLAKLVTSIEKTQGIRSRIKSALFYPAILFTVAVGVITVMLIYVVPVFVKMYGSVGGALPLPTQIVMNVSSFIRNPLGGGAFFAGIVGLVVIFRMLVKNNLKFRRWAHRQIFRIPVMGDMAHKSTLSKLAMVQGNLTSAGVPVLETLDITSTSTNNVVIKESLVEIKRGITSGESLSALFEEEELFPPTYSAMVGVGDKTGNMEDMLNAIAFYYEEEFDTSVDRMTSMLEPLMIVFLGVTIGFIIVAMYMPIFQMGQLMG